MATSANTPDTIATGSIGTSGRSLRRCTASPADTAYPSNTVTRRAVDRNNPSGKPSAMCRPIAGNTATATARIAAPQSLASSVAASRTESAAPNSAKPPISAASTIRIDSGSAGRCMATKIAARHHAATSAAPSTRPAPNVASSEIKSASATITAAARVSMSVPVARADQGGRSRASSRRLVSSSGST